MFLVQNEKEELRVQYTEARMQLTQKENEIAGLNEELDKVKSVLQQKIMKGKPDILATIQVGNTGYLLES